MEAVRDKIKRAGGHAWSPYDSTPLRSRIDRVFLNGRQVVTSALPVTSSPAALPLTFTGS